MNSTFIKSNAAVATQTADSAITWDCSRPRAEIESRKVEIPFEVALRNLPTNDEGENFYAEMKEDVARLNAIRRGEDAGVPDEIAQNPWLTKEIIVAGLERCEKTLIEAGFVL